MFNFVKGLSKTFICCTVCLLSSKIEPIPLLCYTISKVKDAHASPVDCPFHIASNVRSPSKNQVRLIRPQHSTQHGPRPAIIYRSILASPLSPSLPSSQHTSRRLNVRISHTTTSRQNLPFARHLSVFIILHT